MFAVNQDASFKLGARHPCLALQGPRGGRQRNDSVAIGLKSSSFKPTANFVPRIWNWRSLTSAISDTFNSKAYLDLPVLQPQRTGAT